MKTIKDVDLKRKRILVRVDFNVPLKNGKVLDNNRVEETLPTIAYLMENDAKEITLMSHLGDPKGKVVEELRLKPVAEVLAELVGGQIEKISLDKYSSKSREGGTEKSDDNSSPRRIGGSNDKKIGIDCKYKIKENLFLLENTRFNPGEEKNDPEFAKELASMGDLFVFDAFGTAHRAHSSTVGVTKFLPSVAGLLVEKEIKELTELKENPGAPFLLIIGGAKTEDKAPMIDEFLKKEIVENVVVGGRTANLLVREGKYDKEKRVKLPIDGLDEKANEIGVTKENAEGIFDIGSATINEYKNDILKARTLLLAGPMGKFEDERFARGTNEIYLAAATSGAVKYAAGGETVEMIDSLSLRSKFNFISTGGGATLEFLSGKELPAIKALNKKT